MANQGKTTLQLPIKTAPYDASDGFIGIYGYDTANTSNNVAQTCIYTPSAVANMVSPYLAGFPLTIVQTSISLNAANIANLFSNPITIVPAQGANTIIMPYMMYGFSSNGNTWTISDSIGMYWSNTVNSTDLSKQIINTLVSNANTFAYSVVTNNPLRSLIANAINQPLVFNADIGNPTGGTVSLTGSLLYFVINNVP